MNDKDKEAFEKWCVEKFNIAPELIEDFRFSFTHKLIHTESAWQAACEYKDKDIEEDEEILRNRMNSIGYRELKKLQAENKKLREVLEWYADRKNCDNPDFAHVEVDEHGEEIADGGYKAREALKEVGANE